MKNKSFHPILLCAASLMFSHSAKGSDYWWDSNTTSSGFGNIAGTWGTSAFWSTSSAGTATPTAAVTGSLDTVNFGTATLNYANSAVAVAAGGVTVNSIIYGAGQTSAITLGTAGNAITLAGTTPTITVNNANAAQTILSPINGSNGLTKAGNGTLFLSGANSYTGGTTVSAGTLSFRNTGSKSSGSGTHAFSSGTTLGLGVAASGSFFTATDLTNAFNGSMTGNLSNVTVAADTNIGIDTSSAAFTYSASIGSVGRGLVKLGSNNLTLSGNNSYTGRTVLTGGSVLATSFGNIGDASSPLGTNSTVEFRTTGNLSFTGSTVQSSNKTFDIAQTDATFRADGTGVGAITLSANFTPTSLTNKTLNLFGGNTNNNTISGDISNGAGGTLSLLKNLPGKWVLAGANTYTGSTTISAGTLLINGSTVAGSTFGVSAGATLGGTGSIGGAVNVTGVLSPGASIETLGTGTLSFATGSSLVHELNSSVAATVGSDLLKVTGGLNLAGTVGLTLSDIAVTDVAFANGTIFSLINYTGAWNNGLFTLGGNALADEEEFTFGLNTWRISYNDAIGGLNYAGEYAGGSDSFVNLTAVPEPRAALLGGLGLLALLRRRRR